MPPRPRFDRRAPVRELPNINERIKYPQLRVVDSDGKQLGVIDRLKALEIASQRELDLVLVSEKANPPVCRIMDYGKYKFEQEKKAKEARKKSHQTEVKEVKMRYKIDKHDYDVRIGQATKVLNNLLTIDEAIELTTTKTTQFAKRQKTWFRNKNNPLWLDNKNLLKDAIIKIESFLS